MCANCMRQKAFKIKMKPTTIVRTSVTILPAIALLPCTLNPLSPYICFRATTNIEKILTKLRTDCEMPEPELERYLYLQLFNKQDVSIMYRAKVTEEQTTHGSTFQLSELWSLRSLSTYMGDFICFGRYYLYIIPL